MMDLKVVLDTKSKGGSLGLNHLYVACLQGYVMKWTTLKSQ